MYFLWPRFVLLLKAEKNIIEITIKFCWTEITYFFGFPCFGNGVESFGNTVEFSINQKLSKPRQEIFCD